VTEEVRELSVTFTQSQIDAYAEASGDRNLIHLDDEFARSMGLPGTIAHGLLQMGLLARVAGPPRQIRRLSCRFASIVRPGSTVTFRGVDAGGGRVKLEATDERGTEVLTRASAEYFPER
jgi:acyl dehydratase